MKNYIMILVILHVFFTTMLAQDFNPCSNDKIPNLTELDDNCYYIDGANNILKIFINKIDWQGKPTIKIVKKEGININSYEVYLLQTLGRLEDQTPNKVDNGYSIYYEKNIDLTEGLSIIVKENGSDNIKDISIDYKQKTLPDESPDVKDFLEKSDYYKKLKLGNDKIKNDALYVFLNDTLNHIFSTNLLGCFDESQVKRVYFVVVHKVGNEPKAEYISYSNARYPVQNTLNGNSSILTADKIEKLQIKIFEFPLSGNTNTFQVQNGNHKNIFSITLCQKVLVSTNIGIFYSFLEDPDDIVIKQIVRPDTSFNTLSANNSQGKIKAAIAASFYFTKQSLDDLRGWAWKPSINFGLGISEDFIKDYFLGINNQFGWGLNFSAGINVAQVNRVLDHEDFQFNKQFYAPPEVKTFKKWNSDWYIGITIDARILASMLLGRKNENYSSFQNQQPKNPID